MDAATDKEWILVVDDDETLRELIARTLERHGHVVKGVGSGKAAIGQLEAGPVPLMLLLDYRLPDMTGQALVKTLMDRGLNVPFIVMTGQGDERLAVEFMKLGAADYLVKDTDLMDRLPSGIHRVKQSLEMMRRLREAEKEKDRLASQIMQAQKMETVGRLAGGIAHDFNNMIGVILGRAELAMERESQNELLCHDLEEIHKAAKHSADLTKQLLAFARKQAVEPTVVDLNKAVEGMLKMLRRLLGETVRLEWIPIEPLAPIFIDASQLNQILTNLCVNARDAIVGPGAITITTDRVSYDEAYCAAHPDFLPGDFVMLSVGDDGCGMDAETLDHLFEPFFTTKEVGKGTGLGLATVYGVVAQNQGFIHVQSQPGRGTIFRVYLPCHADKEVPRSDREQVLERVPSESGRTILLVEDEPAILKLTTMMLEGLGHNVIAAGSPSKALQITAEFEGQLDLLITDVVMPEMNGRELARRILSQHPGIKCLFMSGYTADVISSHGVQEESIYFLQKPFSMKEMAGVVSDALASGGGSADVAPSGGL